MPLGHLKTVTNMGGQQKENESWKVYENGITPADPTMEEMGETPVAGRRAPHHIDPPKSKGSKPKKRSVKEKEAAEKQQAADQKLEEAVSKDLRSRNIVNPETPLTKTKKNATAKRSRNRKELSDQTSESP